MTPGGRLLRNVVQRLANVFYEGPEPPSRLYQLCDDFMQSAPEASPTAWSLFAKALAREAYQSGYTRGWEASQRDPEQMPANGMPPELIADAGGIDWRKNPITPSFEHPNDVKPEVIEVPPMMAGELEAAYEPHEDDE